MKSVAIIGASNNRNKYSNKAVSACRQQGCVVRTVNPQETVIEGLPVSKGITEVAGQPQLISVYVPPTALLKLLPDITAKGGDELWRIPDTASEGVCWQKRRSADGRPFRHVASWR